MAVEAFRRYRRRSALYQRTSLRWLPFAARQLTALFVASTLATAVGVLAYAPIGATATTRLPGNRSILAVHFEAGGTFEYSFALRNQGRWGVTLLGIVAPTHPTFERVTVLTPDPAGGLVGMRKHAFGPGDRRVIVVRVTFAVCRGHRPIGARDSWQTERVRYSLLGLTRSAPVDLPFTVVVDASRAPRC